MLKIFRAVAVIVMLIAVAEFCFSFPSGLRLLTENIPLDARIRMASSVWQAALLMFVEAAVLFVLVQICRVQDEDPAVDLPPPARQPESKT